MKDLNIQIGDRATFEAACKIYKRLMISSEDVEIIQRECMKILKIERIGSNGWYTVYEKKDLLTDEEREFLKDIIKYYDDISQIEFNINHIYFRDNSNYAICVLDCLKNLKFENIKEGKKYTLKDLGLEEEVCEK